VVIPINSYISTKIPIFLWNSYKFLYFRVIKQEKLNSEIKSLPLGNFSENWYEERSHFVDMQDTREKLFINFWRGHGPLSSRCMCISLKGHSYRFSKKMFSLQCIINVCLIIRQNAVPYAKLKERYKPQMLYYVNTGRLTYIATFIQCNLGTLLNLPFKSILDCVNINRAHAVFTLGRFQSAISGVELKIWNSYFMCPLEIPW
jgi:hypothetical protein